MGYLLLEGGAKFGGLMTQPDLRAMELAGGPKARLSIIPAAAAPDNNHHQAGQRSVRWFQGLGATQVTALPLIDKRSANNQVVAEVLRGSGLIYLLVGIDEETGMINEGRRGQWRIYGKGSVTQYRRHLSRCYFKEETFALYQPGISKRGLP
jgi:cyanophycinase-like exopeptidase